MAAESSIEGKTKRYSEDVGVWTRKFTSPRHNGVPDRIFQYKGIGLFIEFKAPGEYPKDDQMIEIDAITRTGGYAMWADSFFLAKMAVDHLKAGDLEELKALCRTTHYWRNKKAT